MVRWTAANVLGIQQTLVGPNGSGDTTPDYVRVLLCFVLACAVAVVWSAVDWRKTNHPWLNDLLRSYLRYVLAFTMLGYGLAKVGSVMNQFSEPSIEQLMKTYGESSPMNLVWTFMGASRAYTLFAGLGEVAGALLLVWRRTTILGAAVSFGVMLNVVMINFCYDVPVKQYSFHLLVMALYLLLPDLHRLANLLLWNQPVDKANLLPPYTSPRTIWVHRAFKAYAIAMGIAWPLGMDIYREYSTPKTRIRRTLVLRQLRGGRIPDRRPTRAAAHYRQQSLANGQPAARAVWPQRSPRANRLSQRPHDGSHRHHRPVRAFGR